MKKIIMMVLTGIAYFSVANAHADYVCNVTYWPSQGTLGDTGYVRASFYTGAACTGTARGYQYLCGENATSSNCPSSSRYHHNLDVLLSHFNALQKAANDESSVLRHTSPCIGSTTEYCLSNVTYY